LEFNYFFCVVLLLFHAFYAYFLSSFTTHFTNIGHFGDFPTLWFQYFSLPKCSCFNKEWVDDQNPTPHPPLPTPLTKEQKKEKLRKEKKRKPCQTYHQLRASWPGILTKERQSNTHTHVMGKSYIFNKFEMKTSVSIICKRSMKPIVQEVKWPPCKFIVKHLEKLPNCIWRALYIGKDLRSLNM
jgi:hypothetical protein